MELNYWNNNVNTNNNINLIRHKKNIIDIVTAIITVFHVCL